ncbi:hypothetical protein BHS09_33760 [Myxococcus xanthus]|uniref:DUF4384 domain-containing protein n=1 Tax=Myxococcus xanthus TaxID=34 RepID=A0AAE6KVJ5_MYXXA|nr:hypothetical protein [Myxococcus xanthus]QDE71559.1 hypothetical protein BHS09_33760 [Myxococcus xanthus]QDE78840.1 hypothetical protein BHS08_33785 [Myxococcus xanthus]QDF08165.1 hypothetical protein BHS04_33885 [Myxococcus xanthus]
MSGHLSRLALDELVVGDAAPPPHLAACEQCQARLARLREAAGAAREAPEFAWTRTRVLAQRAAPARGFLGTWRWAVPLALALGLASVVVLREPPEGVRVKGGPFVSVVRQADGAVDAPLSPGDVVTLSLKTAPYRYALVFATDAAGKVSLLWPSRGMQSGDPAALVMPPTFIVTPGDFVLDAFFSDAPLPAEPGRAALAIRAAACAARKQSTDCQPPAPLEGAAHHYRLAVPVNASP